MEEPPTDTDTPVEIVEPTGPFDLELAASAVVEGGADNAFAGVSLFVADFDNDDQDDLLVTAFEPVVGAHLLYGPFEGARSLDDADATVLGIQGIFAAGDLDADGWTDLAVEDVFQEYAVAVWQGPFIGTRGLDAVEVGVLPYPLGSTPSVPHIADIDHDGHDDLLVGLPSTASGLLGRTGVRVYRGPMLGVVAPDAHDVSLVDERFDETAGASLDAGHDLDGDGLADLLIGAPAHLELGPGGAWLVLDLPSVDTSLEDMLRIDGGEARATGEAHVAGDLDGDGHADLAFDSGDDLRVLTGPFTSDRTLDDDDARITGVSYGNSAAGGGFLLIGFSGAYAWPTSESGRFDLYDTWVAGVREEPDAQFFAGQLENALGDSAGFGHLDGDADLDLLLGAPLTYLPDHENAGALFVMAGGSW